ncbi:hypothetical protein BDZ91DRAFT_759129 [Kalaharituber pfeilii]|nr:hypothetical protein BDZ91DRAFT_759129 [Kalaharituber pfeilii]
MAADAAAQTAFLEEAFPGKENLQLKNRVRGIIAQNPKQILPVFKSIAEYVNSLHHQVAQLQSSIASFSASVKNEEGIGGGDSPTPLKKRKLENGGSEIAPSGPGAAGDAGAVERAVMDAAPLAIVADISFSVPQRKKFTVVVTAGGIAAVAPAANKVEFAVRWEDIKLIALLPVPEKAVRQLNFCLLPTGSEGLDAATSVTDSAVFTIPDTASAAPKTATGPALANTQYDQTSYKTLFVSLFNAHSPNKVVEPSPNEFTSAVPQPQRKGEPAFHVKAHRGTKDGYLYFLPGGILWAFKKPLAYFEFVRIESVSYTSITKRTFNLNIHVHPGAGAVGVEAGKGEEVEFAMIDQVDYTGIDGYVRKQRLNDASMAEMRRAVVYNVNKAKDDEEEENAGGGGNGATVSDLQRALEQAEEEEEGEDYVPGEGEGESGGSGGETDSEEDGDDSEEEGEGEGDGSDDEGTVDLREELGSELEDVGGGGEDEEMGGVAKAVVERRRRGRGGRR